MSFGSTDLIFPKTSSGGTEVCYNITIVNDMKAELNESFTLVWYSPDSQVSLQKDSSTVIIVNSESKLIHHYKESKNKQEKWSLAKHCNASKPAQVTLEKPAQDELK